MYSLLQLMIVIQNKAYALIKHSMYGYFLHLIVKEQKR